MSASELKKFVLKIDTDGNGYISADEFKKLFKEAQNKIGKLTEENIEEAITAMDKDNDGVFSIKEVIDWMVAADFLPATVGLGGRHMDPRGRLDPLGRPYIPGPGPGGCVLM